MLNLRMMQSTTVGKDKKRMSIQTSQPRPQTRQQSQAQSEHAFATPTRMQLEFFGMLLILVQFMYQSIVKSECYYCLVIFISYSIKFFQLLIFVLLAVEKNQSLCGYIACFCSSIYMIKLQILPHEALLRNRNFVIQGMLQIIAAAILYGVP